MPGGFVSRRSCRASGLLRPGLRVQSQRQHGVGQLLPPPCQPRARASPLLPRMKASPYLFLSCPFTYSWRGRGRGSHAMGPAVGSAAALRRRWFRQHRRAGRTCAALAACAATAQDGTACWPVCCDCTHLRLLHGNVHVAVQAGEDACTGTPGEGAAAGVHPPRMHRM